MLTLPRAVGSLGKFYRVTVIITGPELRRARVQVFVLPSKNEKLAGSYAIKSIPSHLRQGCSVSMVWEDRW